VGRRGRALIAILSLYAIVWGATWALGDKNLILDPGGPFHYPGVFVGGLPPVADATSQFGIAVIAGVIGLLFAGVTLFAPAPDR